MSAALSACVTSDTSTPAVPKEGLKTAEGAVCKEPRPMICTMEYRPVCATLENGSSATYASGCNACADIAVTQWTPNACEDQ